MVSLMDMATNPEMRRLLDQQERSSYEAPAPAPAPKRKVTNPITGQEYELPGWVPPSPELPSAPDSARGLPGLLGSGFPVLGPLYTFGSNLLDINLKGEGTPKKGEEQGPPPPPPDGSTTPPPAAGEQPPSMVEGVNAYREMLASLFPQMPTDNPAQAKADQFAESERKRTALLAQLAFAGGLTAAGGGSWEKVGAGFMGAASAYDDGFERYQQALQDSATRYSQTQQAGQQRDLAITKSALDLYGEEQSDARDRIDKRAAMIDKWFSDEIGALKSDIAPPDPAKLAEINRRRQLSLQLGEYVPPSEDVSDD